MHHRSLLTLTILAVICMHSLNAQTYIVRKIPKGKVKLNAAEKDAVWNNALPLTQFIYPWEQVESPATSFAALWDDEWLYLRYIVKDDSVIVYVNKNEKLEPGASDRVEIFFNINDSMTPYYCLEMDASGRVLDYKADYYRIMHYDWHWPDGQLKIKTTRTKDGYILEAAVSIQSLKDLGLLQNNRLTAGIFRAECKGFVNGRADLHWISWIKPSATEPDFHIPSAFGTLLLQKQ